MDRQDFEMTESDLANLMEACKPVPYIAAQCGPISSPQENANRAWQTLGNKLGFDSSTVQPVDGKGPRFFTALATYNNGSK